MRHRTSPLRLGVVLSLLGEGPGAGHPTTYHGVAMRSALEADFARHLDGLRVRWTYEPRVFDGYLPDFQIALGDRPCYVEVKPTLREAEAAIARLSTVWRYEPTAFLIVACAERSTYFGASKDGPWTTWMERWKHS